MEPCTPCYNTHPASAGGDLLDLVYEEDDRNFGEFEVTGTTGTEDRGDFPGIVYTAQRTMG